MVRATLIVGFAVAALGLSGCAGTWDTLTSKRFRDDPFTTMQHMVSPEDPVLVLRSDPQRDGDEIAAAMRRLKEPLKNGGTREDQDMIVDFLAQAAESDPSPVLRMEAIGALGRFEDPRVTGILIAAYRSAHGRRAAEAAPQAVNHGVEQAGLSAGRKPTSADRTFPDHRADRLPDGMGRERSAAAHSMRSAHTNSPEAVQFLAVVAGGDGTGRRGRGE